MKLDTEIPISSSAVALQLRVEDVLKVCDSRDTKLVVEGLVEAEVEVEGGTWALVLRYNEIGRYPWHVLLVFKAEQGSPTQVDPTVLCGVSCQEDDSEGGKRIQIYTRVIAENHLAPERPEPSELAELSSSARLLSEEIAKH